MRSRRPGFTAQNTIQTHVANSDHRHEFCESHDCHHGKSTTSLMAISIIRPVLGATTLLTPKSLTDGACYKKAHTQANSLAGIRHPRAGGDPVDSRLIPFSWFPASAGMTLHGSVPAQAGNQALFRFPPTASENVRGYGGDPEKTHMGIHRVRIRQELSTTL